MNSPYNYGTSNMIRHFGCIRTATLWAGGFGVVQSLIWMGLTITGIISYNCIIDYPANYTFGSMVQWVFLFTYFRSDSCKKPPWNLEPLQSVHIILDPQALLIWDCVYLGVAVCWLLASVLLLMYIRKDNAKLTSSVMLTWVICTCCICLMDLALGIIFGIDYNAFRHAANAENLLMVEGGGSNTSPTPLIGGMVSAISMMIISFKGFVLWIINFSLMISLLVLSMRTLKDKDGNDTLFMPRKESDDILTTRPPIKAYEEEIVYNSVAYAPENNQNPQMETIEINQAPIERAARVSTDANLKDRRFRNLDAFQQYPPPRYANNNNNNSNNNIYLSKPRSAMSSTKEDDISMSPTVVVGVSGMPDPDYTPPMSRANQNAGQNNGIIRNQRY